MTGRTIAVSGVALLALAHAASAAAAPTISEYSAGLSNNAAPLSIVTGLDGNLWFTQNGGTSAIDTISPLGAITSFATEGTTSPRQITVGSDGNLWFTAGGASSVIGRMNPQSHAFNEYPLPPGSNPIGVTSGPEGDVWFVESGGTAMIGRVVPSTQQITEFAVPTKGSLPAQITVAPEEDLWFAENANPGAIGRLDPTTKVITEYSEGLTKNSKPWGITTGPEGDIWFTEATNPGKIGRINPANGAITEFSTGLTVGTPQNITTGSDGNLYFTETNSNGALGRVTPAGSIEEYAAGLTAKGKPWAITPGPDGNIWFVENANPAKVGRLTVAPTVKSPAVESVMTRAATLTAVVRANVQATSYFFEYGPTLSYGFLSASESAGNAGTPALVSAALSNLTAGTTYHFRVVASNATGTTHGADATFTTAVPPTVADTPVSGLTAHTATLNDTVNPQGLPTTYHFEWGPTTAYGSQVPSPDASVGSDTSEHEVSLQLTGLQPGTGYHYRIVASDCAGCAAGTTAGPDQTFTTSAPAEEPGNAWVDPGPNRSNTGFDLPRLLSGTGSPPPSAVLGRFAKVEPLSGTILVRSPSSRALVPLRDAATVPVGSVVDATHGVLRLVTAMNSHGGTESAIVWGGVFQTRQSRIGNGMTHLILRGEIFPCARRGRAHSSSTKTRRAKKRTLWTQDDHGRYSTHGANSVATVLGTKWETVETCAGTLTRVARGRVRVRDLHRHVTVLVTTGHSYLARP